MTPDKVIEWASEATEYANKKAGDVFHPMYARDWSADYNTRFAQLARADKQEQCAKVCASRDMGDGSREDQEARRCESAIRALKD